MLPLLCRVLKSGCGILETNKHGLHRIEFEWWRAHVWSRANLVILRYVFVVLGIQISGSQSSSALPAL